MKTHNIYMSCGGKKGVRTKHRSGIYAVHDSEGRAHTQRWTITHEPTGLRVGSFRLLKEAKAVARYLDDWAPSAGALWGWGEPGDVRELERVYIEARHSAGLV